MARTSCGTYTSIVRSTTAMRRRHIGRKSVTVDAVFALASSAKARRGLYVDVTRARENVTIAYGKDDVRDFGALLVRAQRDNGKALMRDVVQDVNVRLEHEEEQKRRRGVTLTLEQDTKINRRYDGERGR